MSKNLRDGILFLFLAVCLAFTPGFFINGYFLAAGIVVSTTVFIMSITWLTATGVRRLGDHSLEKRLKQSKAMEELRAKKIKEEHSPYDLT